MSNLAKQQVDPPSTQNPATQTSTAPIHGVATAGFSAPNAAGLTPGIAIANDTVMAPTSNQPLASGVASTFSAFTPSADAIVPPAEINVVQHPVVKVLLAPELPLNLLFEGVFAKVVVDNTFTFTPLSWVSKATISVEWIMLEFPAKLSYWDYGHYMHVANRTEAAVLAAGHGYDEFMARLFSVYLFHNASNFDEIEHSFLLTSTTAYSSRLLKPALSMLSDEKIPSVLLKQIKRTAYEAVHLACAAAPVHAGIRPGPVVAMIAAHAPVPRLCFYTDGDYIRHTRYQDQRYTFAAYVANRNLLDGAIAGYLPVDYPNVLNFPTDVFAVTPSAADFYRLLYSATSLESQCVEFVQSSVLSSDLTSKIFDPAALTLANAHLKRTQANAFAINYASVPDVVAKLTAFRAAGVSYKLCFSDPTEAGTPSRLNNIVLWVAKVIIYAFFRDGLREAADVIGGSMFTHEPAATAALNNLIASRLYVERENFNAAGRTWVAGPAVAGYGTRLRPCGVVRGGKRDVAAGVGVAVTPINALLAYFRAILNMRRTAPKSLPELLELMLNTTAAGFEHTITVIDMMYEELFTDPRFIATGNSYSPNVKYLKLDAVGVLSWFSCLCETTAIPERYANQSASINYLSFYSSLVPIMEQHMIIMHLITTFGLPAGMLQSVFKINIPYRWLQPYYAAIGFAVPPIAPLLQLPLRNIRALGRAVPALRTFPVIFQPCAAVHYAMTSLRYDVGINPFIDAARTVIRRHYQFPMSQVPGMGAPPAPDTLAGYLARHTAFGIGMSYRTLKIKYVDLTTEVDPAVISRKMADALAAVKLVPVSQYFTNTFILDCVTLFLLLPDHVLDFAAMRTYMFCLPDNRLRAPRGETCDNTGLTHQVVADIDIPDFAFEFDRQYVPSIPKFLTEPVITHESPFSPAADLRFVSTPI